MAENLDKGLIREFMKDPEIKKIGSKAVNYITDAIDEIRKMDTITVKRRASLGIFNEHEYLNDAKVFFKKEFNAEIEIVAEDNPSIIDPKNKAKFAKPYHPGIYIE